MLTIRRKEGESSNAMIYRFLKGVQRSGVILETRKRRFKDRVISRSKRRTSALFKADKAEEMTRLKKLGLA